MSKTDSIQDFIRHLRLEKGLAQNSMKAYASDLEKLQRFCSEELQVDMKDCIPLQLSEFIRHAHQQGMSPRSQARIISSLRAFYRYLLLEKYRADDPAELLDMPRLARELPDVLSIEETVSIIESVDLSSPSGHRDRAMLEVLYGCGLRVSELCGLLLSNVSFKEEVLRVKGKGDKERWVPLAGQAVRQLQSYIEGIRREINIARGHEDFVFLNLQGRQLSRISVFNMVKKCAAQAGIDKKVSPHTFRHSFATHMVQAGADLRAVQELLGHSSITTTEIYAHLDREYLREAIVSFHPLS